MSSTLFFLMAKPDAIKRGLVGEIISRFEKKGFVLKQLRYLRPPEISAVIAAHYQEHVGKNFYDNLLTFSLSGSICAMIWEGNIQVARSMVGATLPWDAASGTIRGDYACSLPANLVHCSDGPESAAREVDLWSSML